MRWIGEGAKISRRVPGWRAFQRIVVLVVLASTLSACSKVESYKYKLTMAVRTPDGIKRASSVVEVIFYETWFPQKGTMHKLRGEALYLDLGTGQKPLVALLTSQLHPTYGSNMRWTRDAGPETRWMSKLYGQAPSELLPV